MNKGPKNPERSFGVSVGDMTPPEELGEKARWLEQLGYSHIMVPEDYFYVPALVGATSSRAVANSAARCALRSSGAALRSIGVWVTI